MDKDNEREIRRKKRYTKRKQQVMRQWIAIVVCTVVVVALIITAALKYFGKKSEDMAASVEQSEAVSAENSDESSGEDQNAEEATQETPEERLARVKEEAIAGGYPDELVEVLDKNPETVDLVEHYAEKKDIPPASSVSEGGAPEKSGLVPVLYQWDERWGYAPYGTSTVVVSGCGPTCLSMAIIGLTGDETITPAVVAAYGTANGAVDAENNTLWSFMTSAGSNWGVATREINPEESTVAKELNDGHVIICSVGAGDFTDNGHFIVLTSYDDGNVTVCDPYRRENTEKTWSYDAIKGQMKALWSYSKQ